MAKNIQFFPKSEKKKNRAIQSKIRAVKIRKKEVRDRS